MLRNIANKICKQSDSDVVFSYYAVWFFSFLLFVPFPADDLLRDLIIGNYNFDYSQLYVYSSLMPKYNQYIAFDHILALISSHVGKMWTIRIVQLFVILNFVIPLNLIFNKLLESRKDKYILVVIALALSCNSAVVMRLYLGRPEAILAGWVLWGVFSKYSSNRSLKLVWIISGIIVTPLYWLSIIYVPVCLFVFKRNLSKIIGLLLLALSNILFWQYYSHGLWLHTFSLVNQQIANRYGELVVGENNSILSVLLNPSFAVVSVTLIYTLIKQGRKSIGFYLSDEQSRNIIAILAVIVWFSLPNMIRYCDVVVPLTIILFVVVYTKSQYQIDNDFLKRISIMVACFSIFYAHNNFKKPCRYSEIPLNAKVLTTFNGANYYIPFFNKEKIQVAPCMEIGATDNGVQKLISIMQTKGTLDCSELSRYGFDYLVEKNLIEIPKCLSIYGVNAEYRIWKINHEKIK